VGKRHNLYRNVRMVKQLGFLILWVSRPKWNDAFRKLEVLERREKRKRIASFFYFLFLYLSSFLKFLSHFFYYFLTLCLSPVSFFCIFFCLSHFISKERGLPFISWYCRNGTGKNINRKFLLWKGL
jgi:hypothetical protein